MTRVRSLYCPPEAARTLRSLPVAGNDTAPRKTAGSYAHLIARVTGNGLDPRRLVAPMRRPMIVAAALLLTAAAGAPELTRLSVVPLRP